MPPPPLTAVVDTNVLHELSSCVDVTRAYNEAIWRQPVPASVANRFEAIRDPLVAHRFRRARETLLLAMYLARTRAHTYSVRDEVIGVLTTNVPPDNPNSLDYLVTALYAHFVKDYLLTDWRQSFPKKSDNLRSNAADRHLLEYAKEHSLPLITNEGNGQDGLADVKLRLKAKQEGVGVFSPREFYDGKLDEGEAVDAFFSRFRKQVPRYLRRDRRLGRAERTTGHLQLLLDYFRMVLRGEINP